MLSSPWIAALIALFSWWFSTGIILLVVRGADKAKSGAHGASVFFSIPLFALGMAGLIISASTLDVSECLYCVPFRLAGLGLD